MENPQAATPPTQEKPKQCEACKFAPGKSINTIEQDVCAVCNKPVEWLIKKKENEGRPTKYRDDFPEKVDEYIKWAEGFNNSKGGFKELIGIEGFAAWLGVTSVSIWGWANKREKDKDGKETGKLVRPQFFNAIKRLKEYQKNQLMRDGFYGGRDVNANMAIFLLKVNHDMKEVEHVDHTTDGKPLPIQIVSYKD